MDAVELAERRVARGHPHRRQAARPARWRSGRSGGSSGTSRFVTAVHADGSFDVAEYNRPGGVKFGFDRRTRVSPNDVTFVYVPRRS